MFFSSREEDQITENSIMVAAGFVNRHKQVNKDMDMVNIHSSSKTFFNMNSFPEIGLKWELENVHPLIKRLLSSNKVPNVPIAGRLKYFSKAWKKLTTDQSILGLLNSSVILFQKKPFQSKIPFQLATSREQQKLINTDVKEMFNKGAIRQYSTAKREFLSNLFLVKEKDGRKRPVINLKHLNTFVPYNHFKMEGLQNLIYLLQEGGYVCKLNLKDAYY